ncbi:hypothetical protein HN011_007483 [Eciton burchellii]|nr:hypothetical protein HN011_007483 [Eciton burchellii]
MQERSKRVDTSLAIASHRRASSFSFRLPRLVRRQPTEKTRKTRKENPAARDAVARHRNVGKRTKEKANRVLVFPPVNNYRRYVIHQLVQDHFSDSLRTFSIGQGFARRTVVCYNSDLRSDWEPRSNVPEWKGGPTTKQKDNAIREMGMESQRSPSTSPERKQRQVKSTVEIYRPPAARRASNCSQTAAQTQIPSATVDSSSSIRHVRQRRPDRAVYVPRHRRSSRVDEGKRTQNSKTTTGHATSNVDAANTNNNSKLRDSCCSPENTNDSKFDSEFFERTRKLSDKSERNVSVLSAEEKETLAIDDRNESTTETGINLLSRASDEIEANDSSMEIVPAPRSIHVEENRSSTEYPPCNAEPNDKATDKPDGQTIIEQSVMPPDVLIISDIVEKKSKQAERTAPSLLRGLISPERKVKKIERQKSKPATPPSPPLKINRDECDWDSLFDDNGDCLDPTLIEELTSAVGEVTIEQPKNDYKAYSKQIEVSSDEFAHVVEIYNFPSEFKTSDLAAVFSSFKNGGFELKWVDDTHCLGVFSSPLVAAEVLASDHPFVKTRPLSEATASSKTKARKSAEFLQPYRNRPETCAALARRLVTGALGVKLATARQEREREKNILREAKEKRRLANKQREDVWEGIIPTK